MYLENFQFWKFWLIFLGEIQAPFEFVNHLEILLFFISKRKIKLISETKTKLKK